MKSELVTQRAVELEQKIKALAGPGIVFSNPLREGDYTLITASEYHIRPDRIIARPIAAIIMGPQGVKIRPIRNALRMLGLLVPVTSIIVVGVLMILHPPWKPDYNFFKEARKLMKSIR